MSSTRISRVINRFASYVVDTDDYLQTVINPGPPEEKNWQRLGLSEDEADHWHQERGVWGDLYPQYTNSAHRTKAVTESVRLFMESFIAWASEILDKKITVSPNVTPVDALTFNFKMERSQPTHPTTPIPDTCFAMVETRGGGVVHITCRTQTDARRASMAKNANIIQVAMKIGGTPPVNFEDGTEIRTIGKADSVQSLGADAMGQRVYAYFRWANTKYPHLSGPYSDLVTFIVS